MGAGYHLASFGRNKGAMQGQGASSSASKVGENAKMVLAGASISSDSPNKFLLLWQML